MIKNLTISFCLLFSLSNCESQPTSNEVINDPVRVIEAASNETFSKDTLQVDSFAKTVHVFVALCDNKYQGIVPVPNTIGNGQDPDNNLYWGCGYGIKTFFKKSSEWKLIKRYQIDTVILERLIFKHVIKNIYLVADAYNGKYIKRCTEDFLNASCGHQKRSIALDGVNLGINGRSNLVAYIGHDGLMDFSIHQNFVNVDSTKRNVIILACYSKSYFAPHLKSANIYPLVWTSGLMAPEAYTLHDALSGYVRGETQQQVRSRAAQAYSKYQKCSIRAATNLLLTGW